MTSNIIQFVYQNQIIKIKNPDPNETLLNYIRTKLKKTGTKEGCGSGDCGACSVVIGELKDEKMFAKSSNRKVIVPNKKDLDLHKSFLRTSLQKNFYD